MGQYYKGAILNNGRKRVLKWLYSHDYSNGLKLMEHSWLTNVFVKAFEGLIHKNPQIVVWAGDYAEPCTGRKSNIYQRCEDDNQVKPMPHLTEKESRFVINHTKKMFVDKRKIKPITAKWTQGSKFRIHPLPLLTCEGNGGGGGDFFGDDEKKIVGSWARNLISVDSEKPEGYTELVFDLNEK